MPSSYVSGYTRATRYEASGRTRTPHSESRYRAGRSTPSSSGSTRAHMSVPTGLRALPNHDVAVLARGADTLRPLDRERGLVSPLRVGACPSVGRELLGPGRDLGRLLAKVRQHAGEVGALLEVPDRGLPHRQRPAVADDALDGPAEARHEVEELSRDGAEQEPTAHDGGQLLDTVVAERLSVGGGDLEQHLGLVGRHDRHVGARQDRDGAAGRVLPGGRLD